MSAARYELFLRAGAPLPDEILAELEAACRAASPPVALDPYRAEDGALRGVDLRVDPTGPGAAKGLCALAFAISRERALTVFDPQLARVVGENECAAIEEHAARGGAFAEGAALSPVSGSSSANGRLWLIVALVVVGVLLLMRFLR